MESHFIHQDLLFLVLFLFCKCVFFFYEVCEIEKEKFKKSKHKVGKIHSSRCSLELSLLLPR